MQGWSFPEAVPLRSSPAPTSVTSVAPLAALRGGGGALRAVFSCRGLLRRPLSRSGVAGSGRGPHPPKPRPLLLLRRFIIVWVWVRRPLWTTYHTVFAVHLGSAALRRGFPPPLVVGVGHEPLTEYNAAWRRCNFVTAVAGFARSRPSLCANPETAPSHAADPRSAKRGSEINVSPCTLRELTHDILHRRRMS